MQRIRINNNPYNIPSVSELTFKQFNLLIIKGKVTDLKEYIALFIDMDMDKLMRSEFTGASMSTLHQMIFNVEVEKVMNDEKKTVQFDNETIAVSSLSHKTYGKDYYFDWYHGLKRRDKINMFELCMYALAIALTPEDGSMEDIAKNYTTLEGRKWTEVLPQGFFLAKKFSGSRKRSMRLSMSCTVQSKLIRWKTNFSKRKLIIQERI